MIEMDECVSMVQERLFLYGTCDMEKLQKVVQCICSKHPTGHFGVNVGV